MSPPREVWMTGEQLYKARCDLGQAWKGRPYTMSEFADLLRLRGKPDQPGEVVRDYERGRTNISGPLSLAIESLLEIAKLQKELLDHKS